MNKQITNKTVYKFSLFIILTIVKYYHIYVNCLCLYNKAGAFKKAPATV